MNRCSVCGRKVSNKTTHFGLGCLKNMCSLVDMDKPKNVKGENLLNNKVSQITNKKLLNKEEKVLLTNRYLTLQLLNKVPLSAYDNMKNKVGKDIEVIGTSKKQTGETMITLKQAYEVYKLYNKFQKIKNKSEEVDLEYMQNFLFDNLLFAFSNYYRNKKYLGGVIAEIQLYFWKTIVILFKNKYPNGTDFIKHSLQNNPDDKTIFNGKIVDDIRRDINFQNVIENILIKNNGKSELDVTCGLNYASSDLFLALNNTTINIKGNRDNDKWNLDITITDRYDFTDFKEIDEYCDDNLIKGLFGSTANNMAMISVASGVLHEYNVTIKFNMEHK